MRKTRLKDDLDLLEQSFEKRYSKFQINALGSFKPVEFIRKRPLQVVGAVLFLGLAISFTRRKKGSSGNGNDTVSYSKKSPSFTGIVYDEMKRIAARRAASYMSEWIDQKITSDKK